MCYFSSCVFFFKQKTAYEMRISDWSSDVCSSDLSAQTPGSIIPNRRHRLIELMRDCRAELRHRSIARQDMNLFRPPSGIAFGFDPFGNVPEVRQNTQLGSASCRARVCQDV